MEFTRSEILSHRQAWIDYLKRPETKKEKGRLESRTDSEARCCLGHACHIAGAERTVNQETATVFYDGVETIAPSQVMKYFGLRASNGFVYHDGDFIHTFAEYNFSSLASLNDHTDATPQEIGEYLQTVIEGGPNSPFISIKEYEDD